MGEVIGVVMVIPIFPTKTVLVIVEVVQVGLVEMNVTPTQAICGGIVKRNVPNEVVHQVVCNVVLKCGTMNMTAREIVVTVM